LWRLTLFASVVSAATQTEFNLDLRVFVPPRSIVEAENTAARPSDLGVPA